VLNPVRRARSTYPSAIIIAHSSRASFRWIMIIARMNHEYPPRLTHIIYLLHTSCTISPIYFRQHLSIYLYLSIYLFIYLFIRLFMQVFISNCLCAACNDNLFSIYSIKVISFFRKEISKKL